LWRRLQNLGAIEVTGLYVLPENPETTEAFSWLSQEVESAGGEAVVMQVEKFNVLTDRAIIEKFNVARAKDYQELLGEINRWRSSSSQLDKAERSKLLGKLSRQFEDIARLDFFNSRMKGQVAKMLASLEQTLKTPVPVVQINLVKREDYQNKIWVTRPKPYIDRLASVWLIRRFIDNKATIHYRDKPKANEVSFDMVNATFGHTGNLCTFETLVLAFGLKEVALQKMADIVHELDLSEGYYTHPETFGVEAILKGWQAQNLSDKELEIRGSQLFEGLCQSLKAERSS
jgi:hypothetical protein